MSSVCDSNKCVCNEGMGHSDSLRVAWTIVHQALGALAQILIASLFLAAPVLCQNIRAKKQPAYPNPPASQEAKGGYWRSDHSFQPTLIITNVLEEKSLPVTPSLYAPDGTEYDLPVMTLAPSGVAFVDIRSVLGSAPAEIRQHFSDFGSVGVKYTWNWAGAITTLIQNRDAARSLNFNFDLRSVGGMSHGTDSTTLEGLWWKEDTGVKGFLGLVNVSAKTLSASVKILSDSGEPVEERAIALLPNETKRLDILQASGGLSGGVEIAFNGAESDLVVSGGLENSSEGYSARIPFSVVAVPMPEVSALQNGADRSTVSISSVGLMFGKQDPAFKFPKNTEFGVYLDMRNTTDRAIPVTPTLYYMDGQNVDKRTLAPVILAPRQSRHWSPAAFASELSVDQRPGFVNMVFSYDGAPADVILANGAIDQTRTYVSESHTRAVGKTQAKILSDWDLADGNNTVISILNLDEKAQDLVVYFFFEGGQYKLPVHLAEGGSTMLNLEKIVAGQQPDSAGNTIPLDAIHGTAIVSGSQGYAEMINLAVASSVLNVATATCGNKCPTCFGYSGFQVGLGDPFCTDDEGVDDFCPLDLVGKFDALALGQNGVWMDVSAMTSSVSWSSSNPSVAGSQGSGRFFGNAVGTYTGTATANLIEVNGDCAGTGSPCPWDPWSGSGGGNVTPTITGPNTLWWFNGLGAGASGYQNQITLTASSGGNGTSFQWAIKAGSDKVSLSPSTSATVQVTSVGKSTSMNDVSITVSVGGQTSKPFTITVHSPYALGTDPSNPVTTYTQDPTYVWDTMIHYLILDNFLTPMPSPVSVNENWTTAVVADYTNENWRRGSPGCDTTTSASPASIGDLIQGEAASQYPTPTFNLRQNGSAVYHWGQEWRVGTCAIGSGPRVQTDTIQKYTDHAAHTGIVSPAP